MKAIQSLRNNFAKAADTVGKVARGIGNVGLAGSAVLAFSTVAGGIGLGLAALGTKSVGTSIRRNAPRLAGARLG
ncbi:MAG: hypothetical protein CL565_03320 [Alphaproteobacteria bacterium]|nr:hypothetical protein [Alphaproteobacteria bacterium]|tara:strand:- start:22 stop:246 length:225 start_codon:yes stop_codon:yes gene_type:complete